MSQDLLFSYINNSLEILSDLDDAAETGRDALIEAGMAQSSRELSVIQSFGKAMKNIGMGVLSANSQISDQNAEFFVKTYMLAQGFHEIDDGFAEDEDTISSLLEKTKQLARVTRERVRVEQLKDPGYRELHVPDALLDLSAYDYLYGTAHSITFSHILIGFARLCADHDERVTEEEAVHLRELSERLQSAQSAIDDIFSIIHKDKATISDLTKNEGILDAAKSTIAIDQINELIGIPEVKREIANVINSAEINRIRISKGLPETASIGHFVFHGKPGTGKTTVARLLASALHSIGVLEKGHLVEVDRSGLVAGYVGQTAEKAKSVAESAIGGILFIDEAYTLAKGENDFGQEAIDTILKFMEDNRGKMAVVVAGYTANMSDFINSNPGLKSRFNKFIAFSDYTPSELVMIFDRLCDQSKMQLTSAARNKVLDIFSQLYESRDEGFANARLARNLFQDAIGNQANRLVSMGNITDDDLQTLVESDIQFNSHGLL